MKPQNTETKLGELVAIFSMFHYNNTRHVFAVNLWQEPMSQLLLLLDIFIADRAIFFISKTTDYQWKMTSQAKCVRMCRHGPPTSIL